MTIINSGILLNHLLVQTNTLMKVPQITSHLQSQITYSEFINQL